MSWDAMLWQLKRAAAEREAAKQRAGLMTLPDDPESWVEEYRAYAEALPAHLPQKAVMLRQAELAKACLADGEKDEAKLYMLQLQENWNNAEHDKWVDGVEKQFAHSAQHRNATREPADEARWQAWRDEAERITQEHPKFRGNKSEQARRIKERLNCPETVRTIRNRL